MSRDPTQSDGSSLKGPPDALGDDPTRAPLVNVEAAELAVQDGVESAADLELLGQEGRSIEAIRARQHRLTALLLAPHDAPDLLADVLSRLDLAWLDSASALLDGCGDAPDVSAATLASLELPVVHSAPVLLLGSGLSPELAAAVADQSALEVVDSRAVLLDGAGASPELVDSVAEPLNLTPMRSADALLDGSGSSPDIAAALAHHPGVPIAPSVADAALLHGASPAPELTADVLQQVGLTAPLQETGKHETLGLRALLVGSAPAAPDLTASVFAALDLAEASPMGEMLRDGAGPAPELAGSVLESLGLSAAPSRTPAVAPRVVPLHPATPSASPPVAPKAPAAARRWGIGRWAMVGLPVVAMAAAALIFMMQAVVKVAPTEQLIAFSADVVNQIEIEDISTDVAAVVHVMPGDIDDLAAPTIIFIDVLDDDDEAPMPAGKGRKL